MQFGMTLASCRPTSRNVSARLPNGPRADTFLDVGRQLPKVMPKLHDRPRGRLPAVIVDPSALT